MTSHNVIHIHISDRKRQKHLLGKMPFMLRLIQHLSQTFGRIIPSLLSPFYLQLFMRPRIRANHRTSDELLRTAVRKSYPIIGEDIRVYEWVHKDTAPWALLSHGWESRGSALRDMVPHLHELGYNVIAFDGVAHGESSGKKNHLLKQARVIDKIIDRYNVVGAIGHSFGSAAICHVYAHLRPQETLDFVVLVASPNSMLRIFDEFYDIVQAPQPLRRAINHRVERRFQLRLSDISVVQSLEHSALSCGIIVHDRHDPITDFANAEALLRVRPHFSLIRTEGLGHFTILKNNKVQEHIKLEIRRLIKASSTS